MIGDCQLPIADCQLKANGVTRLQSEIGN